MYASPWPPRWFQSPSLWGQHCRGFTGTKEIAAYMFQSPSLWGQHCRSARPSGSTSKGPCFSPLRYGDSIVGALPVLQVPGERRFSPLRYGDSIVGGQQQGQQTPPPGFQSPSLWGQHCRPQGAAGWSAGR